MDAVGFGRPHAANDTEVVHVRPDPARFIHAAGAADAPTVCLKTTITDSGRTRDTVIVEGSGSRRDDRGATRYLEVLDFARMPLGVTLGQTGYAIVEVLGPAPGTSM